MENMEKQFDKKQIKSEKIPEELEKNTKTIKFIDSLNNFIKKEFEELKIEQEPKEIKSEQIHLVPEKIYKTEFPNESRAVYLPSKESIFMNAKAFDSIPEFYASIVHEFLHFESFFEDKNTAVRSGYRSLKKENNKVQTRFRGLNEMIIDKFAQEILEKNKKDLKKININLETKKLSPEKYSPLILNKIIEKIAQKKDQEQEKVWEKFKKSLFTGKMMHLRDVERTFGKDSLRLLSEFYSENKEKGERQEEYFDILNYFRFNNKS